MLDNIQIEQQVQGQHLVGMRDAHGQQLRQIQEYQNAHGEQLSKIGERQNTQGDQLAKLIEDQQLHREQISHSDTRVLGTDHTQLVISGKTLH